MATRARRRHAVILAAALLVGVPGLSAIGLSTAVASAPPPIQCGAQSIPPNTDACQLDGAVVPPSQSDPLATQEVGVAVTTPAPLPLPDCTTNPGTLPCVIPYASPVITGVAAYGYADGELPAPAQETDTCGGNTVDTCSVTVGFPTSGTMAFPDIEVDVAFAYGTGYNSQGPGTALSSASFIVPTGNVTHSGSITISSVTIDPKVPSSTDPKITGTVTVRNTGPDAVTGIAVAVSSNTPTIVAVSGAPTPASVASLAAGASTDVTFVLKPKKGGDASLAVTAAGHDGAIAVTAKPRTRTFTVDGGITLKLSVGKKPDSDGKATIDAKVINPGVAAVSGIGLSLTDVTGGRVKAAIGKPDPTSFALGGHDSRSFKVAVKLPDRGDYTLGGNAHGHIGAVKVNGLDKLTVSRTGKPIDVTAAASFKAEQIGERGHVVVQITNHLNEDLAGVATTVTATTDAGKATIGTIPAPLASMSGAATVSVPVTLTFPGKVTFSVVVKAHGAATGRAVSDNANADSTVNKPEFTVVPSTNKDFKTYALAEDFKGTGWSTAGGPIAVQIESTNIHTYSEREDFHGSLALPLWPHHDIGGQGSHGPTDGCYADFTAGQGSFRRKVRVHGITDRLLLFADSDPNLTTNMLLCDKEINYVHTTPGTAMYFSGDDESNTLGKTIKLTVVQAGHLLANVVANSTLNVCVNLTDGVRSVTVKAVGPQLHFAVTAARCGMASALRRSAPPMSATVAAASTTRNLNDLIVQSRAAERRAVPVNGRPASRKPVTGGLRRCVRRPRARGRSPCWTSPRRPTARRAPPPR
jgi:hypothetical protein